MSLWDWGSQAFIFPSLLPEICLHASSFPSPLLCSSHCRLTLFQFPDPPQQPWHRPVPSLLSCAPGPSFPFLRQTTQQTFGSNPSPKFTCLEAREVTKMREMSWVESITTGDGKSTLFLRHTTNCCQKEVKAQCSQISQFVCFFREIKNCFLWNLPIFKC